MVVIVSNKSQACNIKGAVAVASDLLLMCHNFQPIRTLRCVLIYLPAHNSIAILTSQTRGPGGGLVGGSSERTLATRHCSTRISSQSYREDSALNCGPRPFMSTGSQI